MNKAVDNNKIEELVDQALNAMRAGEIENGIALFKEVVKLDENDWRYSNELGNCLMQAKRYDEAHQVFDKCVAVAPEEQKAFVTFNKALAYTFEGKLEDALSLHLTILESQPDDIKSNGEAAILLRKLGRYDEALDYAEKTIEQLESQPQQISYLGDPVPDRQYKDQLSLAYLNKARICFAIEDEEDEGLDTIEALLDETANIDRALIMANELMNSNKPELAHKIALQIIQCYGDEEVDADILELFENSKTAANGL